MLAFTVGLCRFYQYYEGMVQVDPETDQLKRQEDSFISPMNTFRTLFWAIFCMSSMDAPAVIIENMNDTESNVNYINKHYFTEFTGYFMFAGKYNINIKIHWAQEMLSSKKTIIIVQDLPKRVDILLYLRLLCTPPSPSLMKYFIHISYNIFFLSFRNTNGDRHAEHAVTHPTPLSHVRH
ncbi:hypothetical protein WDU94_014430 [Cyamophila willieti]